jgi:hypothetical protein
MSLILSGTDGLSDIDGSAATPAIRGTDANTGIFFGADIIGFAEGGAEVARFNADAQFVAAAGTASLPVITTTGDVNTGIFFPAADTIAFAEGGAEAMRIDSSGNVGIGTASPAAKLDVSGSAKATNMSLNGVAIGDYNLYSGMVTRVSNGGGVGINSANSSDNAYIYFGSGTSSAAQQSAAIGRIGGDVLAMFTASAERMRITSGGNVLVNTTSNVGANAKIFAVGSGQGIAVGYGTGSAEYRHLYMNSGDGTLYFFNDTT